MLVLRPAKAIHLLLIIVYFSVLINSSNGQLDFLYNSCLNPSNKTSNSSFGSNLNSLLGILSSKAALNSFYTVDYRKIYGLFLCRGDVSRNACQNCVSNATVKIQELCQSNGTGIVWYDHCLVRYSDTDFFGIGDTSPSVFMYNSRNTSSADETAYGALGVLYTLIAKAPDTELMYGAEGSEVMNGSQSRFGLVQCTRDINSTVCRSCLGKMIDHIEACCQSKVGWRMLAPSCFLRYEEYQFFEQPSAPPAPVPRREPGDTDELRKGGEDKTKTTVIATVVSVAAAAVLFVGCCYGLLLRQRKALRDRESSEEVLWDELQGQTNPDFMESRMMHNDSSTQMHYFSLSAVRTATHDFSDANKLGEGGFGPVYKDKGAVRSMSCCKISLNITRFVMRSQALCLS